MVDIRKLFENIIFAMNFGDEIPERMWNEMLEKHKQKTYAESTHERETIEDAVANYLFETETSVEDFNAEVDKKLGKQK